MKQDLHGHKQYTTTGLINWVVEGFLVMTTISQEVLRNEEATKGFWQKTGFGCEVNWRHFDLSHKVTNVNIFSSALAIERMKRMTGGELPCFWADMEWILHGQAKIETEDEEEPCKGEPYVDLYYTRFPGCDACMHHCQNLDTRAPSVTSPEDWATLQRSLKMTLFDKALNT